MGRGKREPGEPCCGSLYTWCVVMNSCNIALNFLFLVFGILCAAFAEDFADEKLHDLPKDAQTPERRSRIVTAVKILGTGMIIYIALRIAVLASLFVFLKKKDVKMIKYQSWVDVSLMFLGMFLYGVYYFAFKKDNIAASETMLFTTLILLGSCSIMLVDTHRNKLLNPPQPQPMAYYVAPGRPAEGVASGTGSGRTGANDQAAPPFNGAASQGDQDTSPS